MNIWQSYKQEHDCLVHFLCLLAVCWSGVQSACDNHVLACNFAKYSPILKIMTELWPIVCGPVFLAHHIFRYTIHTNAAERKRLDTARELN